MYNYYRCMSPEERHEFELDEQLQNELDTASSMTEEELFEKYGVFTYPEAELVITEEMRLTA